MNQLTINRNIPGNLNTINGELNELEKGVKEIESELLNYEESGEDRFYSVISVYFSSFFASLSYSLILH
jgi:hypothetical protein